MSIVGNPLLLGGGKSNVFAFIVVTYPAGSTLTAIKGSKVLTAGDTTGKWVFEIPEAGTWEIKSKLGDKESTRNVSISYKGQGETITLAYDSIEAIKAEILLTDYARLSNSSSDKWDCQATGRAVTRTSAEPIIMLAAKTSSNIGYGAISLSPTLSITAATQYSTWTRNGIQHTTPAGNTYYAFSHGVVASLSSAYVFMNTDGTNSPQIKNATFTSGAGLNEVTDDAVLTGDAIEIAKVEAWTDRMSALLM